MAYTYENVVDEARKAGVLDLFTEADHATAQKNADYGMSLVGLLKDANNATSETQKLLATESTNQLRRSYGVTGATGATTGGSFNEGTRLVAPEKAGTLTSSDATTYQAVLDDIINQKEFTYDPEQDPTYAAYEQRYLREGRRASEDVLAKAAAMTGGRPSSYAVSAAQQTANQYAAALADMIPTLRQNALAEHNNEMAAKYDILNALEAKQQTDYQKALEEENRKRLQVQDALSKYQALGYATPDVAEILGIPEGKPISVNNGTNGSLKNEVLGWILGTGQKVGNVLSDANAKAGEFADKVSDFLGINKPAVDYSIANKHNDEEGWVIVNGKKLTYLELEKYIRQNKVTYKVDPETGVITYEPGKNWSPNLAVRFDEQERLTTT